MQLPIHQHDSLNCTPQFCYNSEKVETRLIDKNTTASKLTTVRKELMEITLPGTNEFLFKSIIPRLNGKSTGEEAAVANRHWIQHHPSIHVFTLVTATGFAW